VFAFGRRAGDSQVIVVLNNGAQAANVDLQAPAWAVTTARYEDVLRDGASALTFAGRRIRLTLPARSSAVFVRR
jgi:O-glycosyl hydrolase